MKIISFPRDKAFRRFAEQIQNKKEFAGVRVFKNVQCLCIPDSQYESHANLFRSSALRVENNIKVRLHSSDEIPWGVKKIGAPTIWERSMGEEIKVAVIDTGISRKHPDLRGQVKGGADFVPRRKKNGDTSSSGHGTHVAGTIAAALNQRGIVGVAPRAALYDVRAFHPDGSAEVSSIIAGLDWAVENKIDVINMSFGMPENSRALHQAIKRAAAAGIYMVASAGNNGKELEYPARYPEVIAVGAIDEKGNLASFSSRGRGMNVAPGVNIFSTWLKGGYKTLDGTSMAAAHISGAAALQIAQSKRRQSVRKVRRKLLTVSVSG
ncbi:S8 family peptidase [Aneurinibacillus tyrosinisolvens]|uniref:S8 family peptidase n=1 Tax=Aneurinibacillus tyrosinisolvens TaxID=1443435 RepID=UPI00063F8FFA|nr:S8 family peptidase [Aneurinibacillus tyrosinisolvens]